MNIAYFKHTVFIPNSKLDISEAIDISEKYNNSKLGDFNIENEDIPSMLIKHTDEISIECNSGGCYYSKDYFPKLLEEYK